MAKLSKSARLERLALRAARLMKRCEKLTNRLNLVESEVAFTAEHPDRLRLKKARRRVRAPLQQKQTVLTRLEEKGGAHLLEAAVAKVNRQERNRAG